MDPINSDTLKHRAQHCASTTKSCTKPAYPTRFVPNPKSPLGLVKFHRSTNNAAPVNIHPIFIADAPGSPKQAPPGIRSACAAISLSILLFSQLTARPDSTITPAPQSDWGTWEGWGASLSWWANVFGDRNDMADLLFTTNYTTFNGQSLPGLGLNIARYNLGGCNTAPAGGDRMVSSANIPPFKQITGFWMDWNSSDPSSPGWNWSADANQRLMLLKAKARGANRFDLFSNSPMWWMCYNHNPSGSANGTDENLQSWNYQQHATYLATVAQYAKTNWGIPFDTVEPFNEPMSGWWKADGTQEGCHIGTTAQSTILKSLRVALNDRGLSSVGIAASDETSYSQALDTWVKLDGDAKAQIAKVTVHGYEYAGGRRDLLTTAVAGKRLWNSEYGEGDSSGLSMASNLNLDFRWLHPTAWCYWQPFDSGGWGLIQSNPGDKWVGSANPKYFILAQYSRHIRPGMRIMDAGDGNTAAAYDAGSRTLVLVTINYDTPQSISINLSNYSTAAGPIRRWLTLAASGGNKYTRVSDSQLTNKIGRFSLEANTMQTLEILNVDNGSAIPVITTAAAGGLKTTLNWGPVGGATLYSVKRSVVTGGSKTTLGTTITTNFTDTTGIPNITYYYAVSAWAGGYQTANSREVAIASHGAPTLSGSLSLPGKEVALVWPSWASDYRLQSARKLGAVQGWTEEVLAKTTNGTVISCTVTNTAGDARYFRLAR